MAQKIPSECELKSLIGANRFKAWTDLCTMIDTGMKWTERGAAEESMAL
jgi:hypothetical protein